nr:hypothetical protein Itr_chr04CG20170 [Ipomoea trifida]
MALTSKAPDLTGAIHCVDLQGSRSETMAFRCCFLFCGDRLHFFLSLLFSIFQQKKGGGGGGGAEWPARRSSPPPRWLAAEEADSGLPHGGPQPPSA